MTTSGDLDDVARVIVGVDTHLDEHVAVAIDRLGARLGEHRLPDVGTPPEEKIRVVLEGFRREVTVNDLCRREGIKPHSYYAWTKEFMEAGKERLTRDSVRDATRQEIQAHKRENSELKQLVAELSLEAYRLKKTAIPMPQGAVGTNG